MPIVVKHSQLVLVLLASLSVSSCGIAMKGFGRGNVTHPIALWLFPSGTGQGAQCVLVTSASYLPAQRNDEIEFFLQVADTSRCPGTEVRILNWVRKDGVKESPVEDRENRQASKALKVKADARKTLYKYDIHVVNARGEIVAKIDPELEIVH
jgi:hypothetical protein